LQASLTELKFSEVTAVLASEIHVLLAQKSNKSVIKMLEKVSWTHSRSSYFLANTPSRPVLKLCVYIGKSGDSP